MILNYKIYYNLINLLRFNLYYLILNLINLIKRFEL